MTLPQKAPRCHSGGAFDPGYSQAQASPYAAIKAEAGEGWRNQLARLEPLALPLLPCGAGKLGKAPMNTATGRELAGWPTATFTIEQIGAAGRARSVGARTGNGFLCFDVDGPTAVALCLEQGCDPHQAPTWRVERNTDPARLKVNWHLTAEQQLQLGAVVTKAWTRWPNRGTDGKPLNGDKGEAVELFHSTGRQVILLGEHSESGGQYLWLDEHGPEAYSPIPPEWWAMALAITAGELGIGSEPKGSTTTPASPTSTRASKSSSKEWASADPCPICGRDTTAYCARHRTDHTIRCFHGNTFSPEISHGILRKGQQVTGTDGVIYGYCSTGSQPNGDEFSVFRVHQERNPADLIDGFEKKQEQKANNPATPANKVMQLAEVRKRLAAAVADGHSAADLEVLRLGLAGASDQNPAALVGLLRSIEQEHEARSAIAAEARTLRAEADRQEISQALTLDYLFPPSMAEALRVRCRYLPADAPSIALSFLTGVAGLVKLGSEVIGIKAADFRVPMNLYTALVGNSGAKKSPLRKLAVDQPAAPLALDLARAHSRAMEDWTQQNKALPKTERTDPPKPVYVSISSTTVEALAQQLERQEGKGLSLLINRDELSGLFGSLGAYKNGRGDDEQFFLETFDGSGFRSLRVSSPGGGRSYESCSLSIYGTVQPGVLEQLVASGDDSGLWARFLFVPLPQKVVALPEIETELEIEEAAAAAAALAQACSAVYRMPRRSLELSPEARRAFVRYESNAQQEALRASIGAQSALFGKAAGKVLRIAGLLHLLQLVAPDGQASELITADTMERATALVDHINGWTLSLHADLARGGASDLMRMVHRIATAAEGQPIRWKHVQNRLSVKQKKEIDSAAVVMAMEALAELEVGTFERGAKGGALYRATSPLA